MGRARKDNKSNTSKAGNLRNATSKKTPSLAEAVSDHLKNSKEYKK